MRSFEVRMKSDGFDRTLETLNGLLLIIEVRQSRGHLGSMMRLILAFAKASSNCRTIEGEAKESEGPFGLGQVRQHESRSSMV